MTAYTGTVTLPARGGELGSQYSALLTYTSVTALAENDTITWSNVVPNGGAKLVGFYFWSNELDTNATPTGTIVIGDGTDADAYLTTQNMGRPAQLPANGSQLVYGGNGVGLGTDITTKRNIVLTVTAAVATGAGPDIRIQPFFEGI